MTTPITNEKVLANRFPDAMRYIDGGSRKAASKRRKRIRNKREQAWRGK